jgi:two-component system, chemotaxis family, chemotaxis protein CheY
MEIETRLIRQINDAALSCAERALLRCEYAKRLEESGSYDEAREALGDLWEQIGERPQTEGLDDRAAAELLLRVGVLLGWIGSTRQVEGAQEKAKNLISESVRRFEALQDRVRTAEALTDLAYCYWREGAFDEARDMLRDALSRLTDEDSYQKGVAIVRSAIVEKEATRYSDALRILTDNAPLFLEAITSDALRGKFHNELATVLKDLGAAEHREDYIDRALVEYAAASHYFEQAGHNRYRACVENNLGFLFSQVGKYLEAHEHLSHARRLLVNLKDYVHVAQVDETRARVLLAEGRNIEAERIARMATDTLQKGDHQHLLTEALTTHATALARLGRHQQARLTFQNAISIAEPAGDREGAGHALLAAIEELGELFPAPDLSEMYQRAAALLSKSQYPETRDRLNKCALIVLSVADTILAPVSKGHKEFKPRTSWRNFDFWAEIERYEAYWIERALKEAEGVLTRAARLLGFPHHNSLRALLTSRHQDLQSLRTNTRAATITKKRRRRRTARISSPRNTHKFTAPAVAKPIVLHVEDHKVVADAVKETLELAGFRVVTCSDGAVALTRMASSARYDLLMFDNHLPGINGLELVRYARQIPHRRETPIIMLSASEHELEAREAGADVFLRKPEDVGVIVQTVERLLRKE